MKLWSRNKQRSSAAGFGKSSQKKARKRPQTFRLEGIKTPLVVFPFAGHESDPLRHFLDSLHLPNFAHIFAGGTCPVDLPPQVPRDGVPPLFNIDDPFGFKAGGSPVDVPIDWGDSGGTLPPPVVVPVDPCLPPPGDYRGNFIDPALLDFPEGNQPMVGVIDTGASVNNPYFDYSKIQLGRDYVDGDDNPLLQPGEGNEHGTFSLGLIAGINQKLPLWVGRAIGSGKWADSLVDFVNAANLAGKKNAIANLSLDLTQVNPDGSVTTRYELTPYERAALEYARQHGVMIVAAAGNDGGVMSVLGQASQEFDNIITIGSGNQSDRYGYSSYGRGLDIIADGGTDEQPVFSTVGDGLGSMAGTSAATAKVAGAASLVWAANPDLSYRQVIEILEKTATDLKSPGWDADTGFGALNLVAALELAKNTTREVYDPQDLLTLTTWSGEGKVTPEERAVQAFQVQNPWGRRYYYGWLNNSNPMDRFNFTMTSTKLVQLSLKDALGNDFVEAQVSLYDDYGNSYSLNRPDSSTYWNVNLYPGNYHLLVNKGSRSAIDPYKLTLNFNENNNISVVDDSIWLPRPVIFQPPVFTPPPSQPPIQIVIQPPPVDWQKIAEEQAKAELLKKQQEEAAAKAAAEASARAAAEAAAKAAAEAEQRRRSEAEENARKAIALAYAQNKSWLGNSLAGVQIDWNTLLSSRVAAIQYFDGGYVVWNGIHAVAYQTGSGNSSTTNVTPVEVRLHDLGMQYGRHEYGEYVGFSNRQDYYKFTVENLGDFYPQDLLFALRSSGVDMPLTDASIEILDAQMKPIPLSQIWQPNGKPGF